MAKQSSIYKFTGRLGDDLVGYRLKYTVPQIVRTIDRTALSEAVKNGDNYINTRKNASEFGAAGNTAGVLLKTVPSRWKSILNPYSQAKLCKYLFSLRGFTSSNYGKRVPGISGGTLLGVADCINSLQKNDAAALYGGSALIQFGTRNTTGGATGTENMLYLNLNVLSAGSVYLSDEYDGVVVYTFTSRSFLGYYGADGFYNGYLNSVGAGSYGIVFPGKTVPDKFNWTDMDELSSLNENQFSIGSLVGSLVTPMTFNDAGSGDYAKSIGGAVVLIQPFKVINSTAVEYIEQACYFWSATSTATSNNITGSTGSNTGGNAGSGNPTDGDAEGE